MEEQIKSVEKRVRSMYLGFWLLLFLEIVCGETGGDWVGCCVGNVRLTYWAELIVILLTILSVPLSLKLFYWILHKKIDSLPIVQALRLYVMWSGIRLAILYLPILFGLAEYYLFMSSTGFWCTLIALTASLFCLPSKGKIRKELHIN